MGSKFNSLEAKVKISRSKGEKTVITDQRGGAKFQKKVKILVDKTKTCAVQTKHEADLLVN